MSSKTKTSRAGGLFIVFGISIIVELSRYRLHAAQYDGWSYATIVIGLVFNVVYHDYGNSGPYWHTGISAASNQTVAPDVVTFVALVAKDLGTFLMEFIKHLGPFVKPPPS